MLWGRFDQKLCLPNEQKQAAHRGQVFHQILSWVQTEPTIKKRAREMINYTTYYNKTALQMWKAIDRSKVICPCMTSHNLSLDVWLSLPNHENEKAMETLENEPEPPVSIAPGVCPVLVDGRFISRCHTFFIVASSDSNADV